MRPMPLSAIAIAALWTAASPGIQDVAAELNGGGRVTVRRDGAVLDVTVHGPRPGLASLCVSDGSRVRILHASAAAGDATYEADGSAWKLKTGFDWQLRDAATGPPAPAQIEAFFSAHGWSANTSRAGAPERRFRIRMDDALAYLAVAYYATTERATVSSWPDTLSDDCRAVKIAQGYLPDTASFQPKAWYVVKR